MAKGLNQKGYGYIPGVSGPGGFLTPRRKVMTANGQVVPGQGVDVGTVARSFSAGSMMQGAPQGYSEEEWQKRLADSRGMNPVGGDAIITQPGMSSSRLEEMPRIMQTPSLQEGMPQNRQMGQQQRLSQMPSGQLTPRQQTRLNFLNRRG